MPDWNTVSAAVETVTRDLRPRRDALTARELSLVVSDMVRNPREWGGWAGPNWDDRTLTSEICQRIWNTPVHPERVPPAWRGLPWKTLRSLLCYVCTAEQLSGGELAGEQADEWLAAVACNRRCRGEEWKVWLDNPRRWLFRYLSDAGYARICQWESEAA